MLLRTLPAMVSRALTAGDRDDEDLLRHAETNEDADHLRGLLPSLGLVAFVGDGAVLPRASGVDDRPLEGPSVVPFRSPDSLRVDVALPNAGRVAGMGIPVGVTLVAGGGFHGKSTLLRALQAGVVNHVPGDGRERVVTVGDAVKVRAEDGRSVAGVDVSSFFGDIPGAQDRLALTTPNASGSTSQAASMAEALEAGSRTFLMDEDTCATNLMIRDRRMQELVPREGEPITPLVDRVREMHRSLGVSTVLVLGGSGDYLDVADTVLVFRDYEPSDGTVRATVVAAANPTGRRPETPGPFRLPRARRPVPGSLNPAKGHRPSWVRVPDGRTLLFGSQTVDLGALEQVWGQGQIRAMGAALVLAAGDIDGSATVGDLLDAAERRVSHGGLDALDPHHPGDLTAFRRYEFASVLNRCRSLSVLSDRTSAAPMEGRHP
jgi:predicted ABC-class ATPase